LRKHIGYHEPDEQPPFEVFQEAATRKVGRHERIIQSDRNERILDVMGALNEGMPIIWGGQINERFFEISGPRETHNYPLCSPENPPYGGHAIMAFAANTWKLGGDIVGTADALNWYGPNWGDFWKCRLPIDFIMEPMADLRVIRSFMDTEILPGPGFRVEEANEFKIKVTYRPDPADIGKRKSVWPGFRRGQDNYRVGHGSRTNIADFTPIASDRSPSFELILEAENTFYVINTSILESSQMTGMKGERVYAAIGDSFGDWEVSPRLWTVPEYR